MEGKIGQRRTLQREVIIEVLRAAHGPLSVHEILAEGIEEVPSLGISTVYRTLRLLEERGDIRAFKLGVDDVRYEIVSENPGHRHHFICRGCNGVYYIAGCPGGIQNWLPPGFTAEDHEIVVYGRCQKCKKPA